MSRVVVDVFFIVHFSHYLSNTDCDSEYKSCVPSTRVRNTRGKLK